MNKIYNPFKLTVLVASIVLVAASCNKAQTTSYKTPPPTPTPTPAPTPTTTVPTQNTTTNTTDPSLAGIHTPSLVLSPSTQTVKVGDKFDVNLKLVSAGQPVDGVDIYKLHYDPTLLSLTTTPGTLMPNTLANKVDNGAFVFSQISNPGSDPFTGSGTLVTLHFKALKTGTAQVTIDFKAGATNESNIAAHGTNVMGQVVNGTYTIH